MANRPTSRYFWRTFTTLRYGRARSHWQDMMPGLRLTLPSKGANGAVGYKNQTICKLIKSASISLPKDVTIVGSGPSIKEQDLSVLPNGSTILLNGAINLIGDTIEKPASVFIEDERFVWRAFSLMQKQIALATPCFFSPSVLRAICENDADFLTERTVVLIDNLEKPYQRDRVSNEQLKKLDFIRSNATDKALISTNPDKGVITTGTVAFSALQIALDSKAKTIGLAGIDLTDTDQPRFYENANDTAWSGIAQSLEKTLAGFKLGKEIAEQRHIALENYSPTSALQQVGFDYNPRLENQARSKIQ